MENKIEITCSCSLNNVLTLIEDGDYHCESCGETLFRLHASSDYVYILSNPSMPNLLKIGFTSRTVEERVDELNSTGVPEPFQIEAHFGCADPYNAEQEIHNKLNHHRVANNR